MNEYCNGVMVMVWVRGTLNVDSEATESHAVNLFRIMAQYAFFLHRLHFTVDLNYDSL